MRYNLWDRIARLVDKYFLFVVVKGAVLARVVKHNVLSRELEQHGIVEELVDGHVLGKTFPPPEKDSTFYNV